MGARDEVDEVCPNGTVILWSGRTDHTRTTPVWVRYPCCGREYETNITDLDRYRSGRVSRCEDCKRAPQPLPLVRPTCPQCGLRPVQGYYHDGSVTGYGSRCWVCSSYDPAKRAARWRTRGT